MLPTKRGFHSLAGLRQKGGAAVKETARIAEYLSKEGQALLPLVDLVEEARPAVGEPVHIVGRPMRHVGHWRDCRMAPRWVASAYLGTDKRFSRIKEYPEPLDARGIAR